MLPFAPDVDPLAGTTAVRWGCRVQDLDTGAVLWERETDAVLKTASVGKVFLLLEIARRLEDGRLAPDEIIPAHPDDVLADSGILYQFRRQDLCIEDLCLLVGAVSDNMATNLLLRRVGLAEVQFETRALGFAASGLVDRVRLHRAPDDPLTLSRGNADELCRFVEQLEAGTLHSEAVSARVRRWLRADTDLSMVAQAFYLDPLAHMEEDHRFILWNKTGTISDARIDIGSVTSTVTGRRVGYAVLANWPLGEDHRRDALQGMWQIGAAVRSYLEA